MDEEDLTGVDRTILDILHEGARTQSYIVTQSDRSRTWVNQRLNLLDAHDIVENIHEKSASYELRNDPRPESAWPPYSILECMQERIERDVPDYQTYQSSQS